ncbi:MAG TPA: SDR family NAD(P)-dependent oxidoreductase, partial [Opitutaceae bacterium]
MALSVGGTLRTEPDAPSTLTGALERAAAAFPKNGVTHIRQDGTESRLTYPDLLALAQRVAGGLRSQGLSQGDRLLLQLPSGEEFIPAFWGCMLAGVLPVPLALPPVFDQPHALISKLQNAWRLLGRPRTLTTRSLQKDVRGLPTSEPGRNFDVIAFEDLLRAEPAGFTDQAEPEDPALLLLTSGSTGIPKAVVLSHRNLLGYSRGAAQMNQFTPDDVSLNWMPLDHVGGIVMFHVRDVVVGCNHIDAPTDVVLQSPLVWLEWVSRLRVTITWAPNFAFGLVNDRADELPGREFDLRCLRFILNGGEAIVTKTARRFLELLAPCGLPPTSMKPAWGMSETSSGVTYSDRFDLEQTTDLDNFVEVGAPIPGISIRIVDGLCRLLEEGQLGSLQVKGLSVTGGYLDNAALNSESFTEDGWFRTGDLGVIRDGRLTITGREKDVIIINGVNFHSHEIEAVAEEVDGVDVSFTAACAVRTMGEPSDQLAVFYASPLTDAGELAGLARRLRAALVRLASVNPEHLVLLPREEIPKTSIGKIQRRLLKERFEAGEFDERRRRVSDGPASAPDDVLFQRVWRRLSRAADGALPAGPWLILCDPSGIGDGLADRIRRTGAECYTAHAGAGFRTLGSNAFTVDPGIPDNFVSLYGVLRKEGCTPVSVVHCWGLAEEGSEWEAAAFMRERTLKLESVLWAAQAITRGGEVAGGCCLWVVTRRAFGVHAGERVSPAASAVAGLLRTLPQESGSLSCSQIDLGGDGGDASVDMILSEFSVPTRLAEVALRGSVRWQPFLAEADRVGSHASPPPLVMKGVYLLSGGAGGIGGHVARFLISQYDARVLIVGRSPEALVAAKLREVGGHTGQVRYDSVDIGDLPGVLASVSEAENAWGRTLDGIFHLAGSHETRLLDDETPESFGRGLHGKVAGGWALDQLARSRPGVLVVNFSSLLGYFGGYEQGAYSASNAYLEGLALQQRAAGLRSSTLLWSSWLNTGMNSDPSLEEAKRAKGYRSLSPGKGLELLDAALRLGPGVFL